MAARLRFRRSRHVVCSLDGAAVTLRNYAVGTRTYGPADLCTILAMCEDWRSSDAIAAALPHRPVREVTGLVSRLVGARMLYRSDRKEPTAEHVMLRLAPWNPEVGFFHMATKDVNFGDRFIAEQQVTERTRGLAAPPPVKRYRGAPSIALPHPPMEGQFPNVLLARRTWRRFSTQALPLDELSRLLDLTAGIQQWTQDGDGGRVPLKTSPSGGARHSIDVYILALRVRGLRKGLYHYAADRHRLDRLPSGVRRNPVMRYLPAQVWYEDAAALLLFAVSFDRLLYRYQYSRAYRAALIEAGHLCQTFCLTATWRGLAPFCSMALADTTIERDLGLNGIGESVLYAAGLGYPDGDATTGAAPRDARPSRIVANPVFARHADDDHATESPVRSRNHARRSRRGSRARNARGDGPAR